MIFFNEICFSSLLQIKCVEFYSNLLRFDIFIVQSPGPGLLFYRTQSTNLLLTFKVRTERQK